MHQALPVPDGRQRIAASQDTVPSYYISVWMAGSFRHPFGYARKFKAFIDCAYVYARLVPAVPGICHIEGEPVPKPSDGITPAHGMFCYYNVEIATEFKSLSQFLGTHHSLLKAHGTQLWVVGVRCGQGERQVSLEDGEKLARKHDALFSEVDNERRQFFSMLREMFFIVVRPREKRGT